MVATFHAIRRSATEIEENFKTCFQNSQATATAQSMDKLMHFLLLDYSIFQASLCNSISKFVAANFSIKNANTCAHKIKLSWR